MKWPWQERAEVAERRADEAERELKETKKDWPEVRREAAKSRAMREANGWTETIAGIFGGKA